MNIEFGKNEFYINNESGKRIAEITFKYIEDKIININHTFVDPILRGQKIAQKLLDSVVKFAEDNELKIIPTCSYAVVKMKDEKYKHILAK